MDTYVNLRTAVQDFLGRADATTARCDYFIDLAETWFNGHLRTRAMETYNGAFTAVAGFITHPTDWLEWKNLAWFSGKRYPLEPITTELQDTLNPGAVRTGVPLGYFSRATDTQVVNAASGVAQGTYYQKVPALSTSQTSNWLLASYPDAYLYGSLVAAEVFYYDDPRMPTWKNLFDAAVDGINKQQRFSGQAPKMRITGITP